MRRIVKISSGWRESYDIRAILFPVPMLRRFHPAGGMSRSYGQNDDELTQAYIAYQRTLSSTKVGSPEGIVEANIFDQ